MQTVEYYCEYHKIRYTSKKIDSYPGYVFQITNSKPNESKLVSWTLYNDFSASQEEKSIPYFTHLAKKEALFPSHEIIYEDRFHLYHILKTKMEPCLKEKIFGLPSQEKHAASNGENTKSSAFFNEFGQEEASVGERLLLKNLNSSLYKNEDEKKSMISSDLNDENKSKSNDRIFEGEETSAAMPKKLSPFAEYLLKIINEIKITYNSYSSNFIELIERISRKPYYGQSIITYRLYNNEFIEITKESRANLLPSIGRGGFIISDDENIEGDSIYRKENLSASLQEKQIISASLRNRQDLIKVIKGLNSPKIFTLLLLACGVILCLGIVLSVIMYSIYKPLFNTIAEQMTYIVHKASATKNAVIAASVVLQLISVKE